MKPESVFFITGGAGGIGTATAQLAVDHGHKVAVCDIDDDAAHSFADRALDPREVARAIYRAADRRPRENVIPALRGKGLKAISGYPGLMARVLCAVEKKGGKVMEKLRRETALEIAATSAQRKGHSDAGARLAESLVPALERIPNVEEA